jgi:hypothetical protein
MRQLDNGAWADPNPHECPCGSGWFHSDYNTFHKCPYHHVGQPHPDWDDYEYDVDEPRFAPFDYAAANKKIWTDHYERCVRVAADCGLDREAFDARVVQRHEGKELTDRSKSQIAGELSDELWNDMREWQAQEQGYSCDLERRLDEEAMWERKEREWNGGW